MTQAIVHSLISTGRNGKKAFYIIVTALLLLSFFYAYYVNKTVMNVVLRGEVYTKIVELSSDLGELEFEYIKYKNTITLDYTHSLGFADASNTIFISRRSVDTRLTLYK